MKTMTLVARHLYFGMDPLRLRDAANRILSRVPEDVSISAAVKLDALIEDFHLTPAFFHVSFAEFGQSQSQFRQRGRLIEFVRLFERGLCFFGLHLQQIGEPEDGLSSLDIRI